MLGLLTQASEHHHASFALAIFCINLLTNASDICKATSERTVTYKSWLPLPFRPSNVKVSHLQYLHPGTSVWTFLKMLSAVWHASDCVPTCYELKQ